MPDSDIARLTDRFMRRIQSNLNAAAPSFDRFKVGPAGGMLLMTLAEIQPARLQDLVSSMSRDKSQLTRAVKSLEGKGLIQRTNAPQDARATLLSLSEAGEDCVIELERAVASALGQVLEPLTDVETETLRDLLRRI